VPIDTNSLTQILADYFPGLLFFQGNNVDDFDIRRYVDDADGNGPWTLDLKRMSRSPYFSHLFPKDISYEIKDNDTLRDISEKFYRTPALEYVKIIAQYNNIENSDHILSRGTEILIPIFSALWNEETAKKKYNNPDVIWYFIDVENDKFLSEFSTLTNTKASLVNTVKDAIPRKFLDELEYYNSEQLKYYDKKPVWEDWDFSEIVKHKPYAIYKAFLYYAHKFYTLLGFGLCKLNKEYPDILETIDTDGLLAAGCKQLDNVIREEIPETKDFIAEGQILETNKVYRWKKFFEIEQEVLESVPTGGSIYIPTKMDILIDQLKSRIPDLYKNGYDDSGERTKGDLIILDYNKLIYDTTDIKNINNHMSKIVQYIDKEDYSEYRRVNLTGTYREKVRFLYLLIMTPSIIKYYSEFELGIVSDLFYRLFPVSSIHKPLEKDGETDESFFLSDILKDERNISPVVDYFREQFRNDIDKQEMMEFTKNVSWYLDFYKPQPKKNTTVIIKVSDYYKGRLFSKFCELAKIREDEELRRNFFERIQMIIDNYNTQRSKP